VAGSDLVENEYVVLTTVISLKSSFFHLGHHWHWHWQTHQLVLHPNEEVEVGDESEVAARHVLSLPPFPPIQDSHSSALSARLTVLPACRTHTQPPAAFRICRGCVSRR
jgi:hypothetical protein